MTPMSVSNTPASERWPSAERWSLHDGQSVRRWESTEDHRRSRQYRE